MMPGMPERRTRDYVRSGTTTLFAALDVPSGRVIGSPHRRHHALGFRNFLTKIDSEVPDDLPVYLICEMARESQWAPVVRACGRAVPTEMSTLGMQQRCC